MLYLDSAFYVLLDIFLSSTGASRAHFQLLNVAHFNFRNWLEMTHGTIRRLLTLERYFIAND